jgi:hypothetical protein
MTVGMRSIWPRPPHISGRFGSRNEPASRESPDAELLKRITDSAFNEGEHAE